MIHVFIYQKLQQFMECAICMSIKVSHLEFKKSETIEEYIVIIRSALEANIVLPWPEC